MRLFVEFWMRGFGDNHIYPSLGMDFFFFILRKSEKGAGIGNLGQEFVEFSIKYYNFAICAAP